MENVNIKKIQLSLDHIDKHLKSIAKSLAVIAASQNKQELMPFPQEFLDQIFKDTPFEGIGKEEIHKKAKELEPMKGEDNG